MNFIEALGYSFKGQNIPKILTIVLVFIIIGVSIFVSAILFESVEMVFVLFPVLIAYSVFVAGYSISAISSVMDGNEALPKIQLGRDLGRGAVMMIANIVYAIPFMILFFLFFGLIGVTAPAGYSNTSASEPDMRMIMTLCGSMLGFIVLSFGLGYSYVVGQIRYAAEDRVGALFNIPKNFGIVMSNLGKSLGLFLRHIGLAIVFALFSSMFGNIILGFSSGLMNDFLYVESSQDLLQLGMPLALFGSIYYIFVMTVNLMQTLSSTHLIARYGMELGLAPDKLKNDAVSSGSNTILFVIAVIVLLGLAACAVVAVLALAGPAVGDIFSEVITGLE